MPVAEDIRLYGDQLTDDSLDGKASTVDLRLYVLDYYPASSLVRFRHQSPYQSQLTPL
jgi:hypothetical protein